MMTGTLLPSRVKKLGGESSRGNFGMHPSPLFILTSVGSSGRHGSHWISLAQYHGTEVIRLFAYLIFCLIQTKWVSSIQNRCTSVNPIAQSEQSPDGRSSAITDRVLGGLSPILRRITSLLSFLSFFLRPERSTTNSDLHMQMRQGAGRVQLHRG